MYSWEIRDLLKERNYQIGGDELAEIININNNPQIEYIRYFPMNNSYYMKDKFGEEFRFYAIPYEIAKQKGLVRKK